jgi:predicted esterase
MPYCNTLAANVAGLIAFCVLPLLAGTPSLGGEVRLRNGMVLEGSPVPIQGLTPALIRQKDLPTKTYSILMIATDLKRSFVGKRQIAEGGINRDADLSRYEIFELEQTKKGGKLRVQTLGGIIDRTVFDKFGRRRLTLAASPKPLEVIQGVTKITPRYLVVNGLNYQWEHGVATSSVDPPILDAMLREATNANNPNDRLAIAVFYMQAERYPEADRELEAIRKQFPDLEKRVDEISSLLRQAWAKQLLRELRQRRDAGQHQLAYTAAKKFPRNKMSAAVLREIDELLVHHSDSLKKAERVVALLGEQQAKWKSVARPNASQQFVRLGAMRSEIKRELDHESLSRLEAFLTLAADDTLAPEKKLALAYSGWVLGSQYAIDDLSTTTRLWDARFRVLEFLRSDDVTERETHLDRLLALEGVTPERIAQLIPLLPPVIDTPNIRDGVPTRLTVPQSDLFASIDEQPEIAYTVVLPHEYSPYHSYPLIVALRPGERTAQQAAEWWSLVRKHPDQPGQPGQSQRRGYIVIAPEYVAPNSRAYDYSGNAHRAVLESIRNARKRFSIDSDRIFLSGHGMGGNAAIDIGITHPHVFAGVIPISALCDKYTRWYWSNAEHLAWYIINGELDRNSMEHNSRFLSRMMPKGDVIYTEFVGRGYESFYSEIHHLFDWMELHTREKDPKEFEAVTYRLNDGDFYWVHAEGPTRKVLAANSHISAGQTKAIGPPMKIDFRVSPGNTVDVGGGASRFTILLSPEFVDFDKRVVVTVKGKREFSGFLSLDPEVMLEDLRIRGDRQRLYSARFVVDRPHRTSRR